MIQLAIYSFKPLHVGVEAKSLTSIYFLQRTAEQAAALGIPLSVLDDHPKVLMMDQLFCT
jgi:hypothetical protein